MTENETLFGKLFNSVPLYSIEHLDILLSTINKETAINLLIHAVKMAYDQNIYTLGESEVISKSIRVLSNNEITNEDVKSQE